MTNLLWLAVILIGAAILVYGFIDRAKRRSRIETDEHSATELAETHVYAPPSYGFRRGEPE